MHIIRTCPYNRHIVSKLSIICASCATTQFMPANQDWKTVLTLSNAVICFFATGNVSLHLDPTLFFRGRVIFMVSTALSFQAHSTR